MDFRKGEVAKVIDFPAKEVEHSTPMLEEAAKAVEAAAKVTGQQQEMEQNLKSAEVVLPPAPVKPVVKEKKVIELFTCKSDIYCDIFGKIKKAPRPLTRWEYDFLTDFYTTDSVGKQFLQLQGDLRQKYGVMDADQAEL